MSAPPAGLELTCVDMKTKDVFQVGVTAGDTMGDIRMIIAASNCTMGLSHFMVYFKTCF